MFIMKNGKQIMIREHNNRDEVAIKDPASQIIKWISVIEQQHDLKVEKYQLDTVFDSTLWLYLKINLIRFFMPIIDYRFLYFFFFYF
jgi:hypothetical protein